MAVPEPDATTHQCPHCGTIVEVSNAEPLARITCPQCGEKFHVEHAFDHFVLLETLGVGGMGSVYKARDTRLDRLVALKILRRELSLDPIETARLEQEARVTAAVNHPNVVQLFSTGNDHSQFYLVMELVDHGSLEDLITEQGKLPEKQVLDIGIQIAQGLQAAQEKGLIHRDIKPANILFANERTAKIGDFGLAVTAGNNAEAQDEIWGTPYYVAPERLNNEPEDFRSDIFSLGAMLFHAIAGKPPIDGESTSASELRAMKSRPPDLQKAAPGTSRLTAKAINRMIVPDPRLRQRSYAEVITTLQRARLALERGGGKRVLRSPAVVAAIVVVLGVTAAAIYRFQSHPKHDVAASENTNAAAVPVANLQPAFDAARHQIIAGEYKEAVEALKTLEAQAPKEAPIANWIVLQRGLAELLAGENDDARAAFQEMERNAGTTANADLRTFFEETARTLGSGNAIPAAAGRNAKPPQNFGAFLFGVADWQLSDFASAAMWFEEFTKTEVNGDYRWINDYKPLANKFLAEYRAYAAWKESPHDVNSESGITAALSELKAARENIQPTGTLAKVMDGEQDALSSKAAELKQTQENARMNAAREVHERELPTWNAALADYRAKVGTYDYSGARRAVTAPQLTDPELKDAQAAAIKKAGWLNEWKMQFAANVKARPIALPLKDSVGNSYSGLAAVDPVKLTVTLSLPRYGSAVVSWQKATARTLLDASRAYAVAGDARSAGVEWRCAVFAAETGQLEAAKTLGEAAAQANPEYRQYLPLLTPAKP